VPLIIATAQTPAWKALSMGARVLYLELKRHHFLHPNNNGRIYLSQRKAVEEMGASNRDSVGRWFAELEHFGFIVKTAEAALGVDGKGKAPQWRLTELDTPYADQPRATRDFERWDGTPFNGNQAWRGRGARPQKQNPGRETTARAAAKQRPPAAAKQRPVRLATGRETTTISQDEAGRETAAISRITTPPPNERRASAPAGSAVASEPLACAAAAADLTLGVLGTAPDAADGPPADVLAPSPLDWRTLGYPAGAPTRDEILEALERRARERDRSRNVMPVTVTTRDTTQGADETPRPLAIAVGKLVSR
jgi:helix-turn-helix protein